jgi:hypothetical protein
MKTFSNFRGVGTNVVIYVRQILLPGKENIKVYEVLGMW